MLKKLMKHKIILRIIIYIIVTFTLFTIWSLLGSYFFVGRYSNELKQNFTKKELDILKDEFDFSLSGSETLDYARCHTSRGELQVQVWIINVKDPKKFIENNLNLSFQDFKESMFEPYDKSGNGKAFYDYITDSNYDETDEISNSDLREGKTFVKGLHYEKDLYDYAVQIYKLPSEKTYTVTISKAKGSDFKSDDILDMF